REMGGGSEMRAVAEGDRGADDEQNQKRNVGADASGVLQPLADVEANDVQPNGDQQQSHRDPELEGAVAGEAGSVGAKDVGCHRSAGQQQPRKVEEGVDPVGPAGDEAVEVAEG